MSVDVGRFILSEEVGRDRAWRLFPALRVPDIRVSISGGQDGAYAPCHITPIPLHRFPMTKYEPRSGFVYLGNVSSGRVGLISSLTQVGSRVTRFVLLS